MLNYKLPYSIIIFTIVNLILSILYVLDQNNKAYYIQISTFVYGFTLGLLTLQTKAKLFQAFFLGILFYIIFIVSSFSMMGLSKKIFNTDELTLILSTILSVTLIVTSLRLYFSMTNIFKTMLLMIFFGILGGYIGNYFLKAEQFTIFHSFVSITFLWQMGTGIPLLINLDSNRK